MQPEGIQNFIYNNSHLGKLQIAGNVIDGITFPQVIVINLISRPDRQEHIIAELSKWNIPFSFYHAELHPDPVRGCLESHINVIKWAKLNNFNKICIFEDDVVVQEDLRNLPTIDFDMLYLGGLCTHIDEHKDDFVKGHIYCNHAYIINNSVFNEIIEKGWEYDRELDRFYTNFIHTNFNAYLTNKQYVLQCEGWSDIDRKEKWNNYKWPNPGDSFWVP